MEKEDRAQHRRHRSGSTKHELSSGGEIQYREGEREGVRACRCVSKRVRESLRERARGKEMKGQRGRRGGEQEEGEGNLRGRVCDACAVGGGRRAGERGKRRETREGGKEGRKGRELMAPP